MNIDVMTNAGLKKLFLHLNQKYFDGKLDKSMSVKFEKDLEDEETGTPLNGTQMGDEILINNCLKLPGADMIVIVLLHEMIHASLPPCDNHGPLFHAKVVDLFVRGAYNGIL